MSKRDQPVAVLWARKWLILGGVVLFTLVTYLVVGSRTPVYEASAKMAVTFPNTGASTTSFDQVQANQAFARTLVEVIGSRNVADLVVQELPFRSTPKDAADAMQFSQVTETQLIEVQASDTDPVRAQELANTWARTFEKYARSRLIALSPGAQVLVADPAVLPSQPASPRPKLSALVALLLSAGVAVAAALLHARWDDRLDVDTLAEEFGIPVLALVPRRGATRISQHRFEEAVRVLRTNLQYSSEATLRSVALTSTRQSEGKSTITAELARATALLSLVDGAVLAVDADLRRPMLLERLGLGDAASGRGFTTWLAGGAPFEACIRTTDFDALRVMPAGPLPDNPSTLLGFASSREAVAALADRAELLLFDTPPVTAGADAALISTLADGVVIVVDPANVRHGELAATLAQLERVKARVLGFVVNRVVLSDRSAAAAYAYEAVREPDTAA